MISTHITIWLSLVILAFHISATTERNQDMHRQQRIAFLNFVNSPTWRRRSKLKRLHTARATTGH